MFTATLRDDISQGDVFLDIPFLYMTPSGEPASTEVNVALLSHDCDFDKPSNPYCLVACVSALTSAPPGAQNNIRAYKVINTFYLSAIPGVLSESFIDLRLQCTIDKAILNKAARDGHRITSLTDEAREALQDQIFLFFARQDVPS